MTIDKIICERNGTCSYVLKDKSEDAGRPIEKFFQYLEENVQSITTYTCKHGPCSLTDRMNRPYNKRI